MDSAAAQTGIIIIGRNEENNLHRAFKAIPVDIKTVLYVDSGSTDQSISIARKAGFGVHELSPDTPFSAARARSEGADIIISKFPDIEYIFFMDGDCESYPGWIDTAASYLKNNPETAIVCGKLQENSPESSVYNWLSLKQWQAAPIGDITNCGGIFTIRKDVYSATGGFDKELLTMEEQEFCSRVLKQGYKIHRINTSMAIHESGLLSFSQWRSRAVWGGYGAALRFQKEAKKAKLMYLRRYLLLPALLPLSLLLSVFGLAWSKAAILIPFLYLSIVIYLFIRISVYRLKKGDSRKDAMVFSFFTVLRKFPVAVGFFKGLLKQQKNSRPDHHSV